MANEQGKARNEKAGNGRCNNRWDVVVAACDGQVHWNVPPERVIAP